MTARIGSSLVLERAQPVPRIGKMCRKASPCLHRMRKIVMLLADFRRRMLEYPRDQANLLRCVHRQKGRCRPTEVVKTHGLSEFGGDLPTSNGIQAVRAQRRSPIGCPETVMRAATDQDGSYLFQIAHEIGKELLRYPEALRASGLSVRRMQEKIHACIIELKMTAD